MAKTTPVDPKETKHPEPVESEPNDVERAFINGYVAAIKREAPVPVPPLIDASLLMRAEVAFAECRNCDWVAPKPTDEGASDEA